MEQPNVDERVDVPVQPEPQPAVDIKTCQICSDDGDVRQCKVCHEWTCSGCAKFAYDGVTCVICQNAVPIHPL